MPKKQKSAAARQTWRSVALEEESLRFAESGGFLSLEEIEQPLYDPAQPFSAAADDVEAGDSGVGASQLELAQAEVDRLMRMHAAAPRGEDAAAEGERKEKRKRAKAARNDQGCSVADNAEGEAGGEAGDVPPPKKKRSRQKKRKKSDRKESDRKAAASKAEAAEAGAESDEAADGAAASPQAGGGGCGGEATAEAGACVDAAEARSSWEPLGLHPTLVEGMVACGFSAPTPIQKAALPAALHGLRDVVGAAETGSGKTLAFGLPILHRLIKVTRPRHFRDTSVGLPILHRLIERFEARGGGDGGGGGDDGLFALILTPTRELAMQVCSHLLAAASAAPHLGLTARAIVALVGGPSPATRGSGPSREQSRRRLGAL